MGDSNTKPLVSVVVLTWNTAQFIERCLESLHWQTYPDVEIIVVDNASSDNTADVVEASGYDGVKLLRLNENLGCAGGNNAGWRAAQGEVIVFLNPDVVVAPDYLENLIRGLMSDKDAVIAGCKMYYPNSRVIQHAGAGGILHPNAMCEHYGNMEEDEGQYDDVREVAFVTGAGIAVWRWFLEEMRGFDEDYYPAYYEETDLCWRARKEGYKVLYIPDAVLYHYESAGLTKLSPAFYRMFYESRIRFLVKNYSFKDWLFKFLPFEIKWFLFESHARGCRLKQFPAYWKGVKFMFRRKFNKRKTSE
jgi:GT2 family glycosyltransferase